MLGGGCQDLCIRRRVLCQSPGIYKGAFLHAFAQRCRRAETWALHNRLPLRWWDAHGPIGQQSRTRRMLALPASCTLLLSLCLSRARYPRLPSRRTSGLLLARTAAAPEKHTPYPALPSPASPNPASPPTPSFPIVDVLHARNVFSSAKSGDSRLP